MWKWIVPSVLVVLIAWLARSPKDEQDQKSSVSPPVSSSSKKPLEIKEEKSSIGAVYAIGDMHGDEYCARYWVNRTGLIGENGEWADSRNRLVFVGDYLDKGPTSKQTLEFVKSLTDQFPLYVTALMGNHEMELLLDRDKRRHAAWGGIGYFQLAYSSVHPGEYRNFIPYPTGEQGRLDQAEDEIVIDALYNASLEVYGYGQHRHVVVSHTRSDPSSILNYVPPELRPLVQRRMAVFHQHYIDAFRSGTELGSWLEQRPVVALIDGTLFVHGGISSNAAKLLSQGVDLINQELAQNAAEDKLLNFIQDTYHGNLVYDMLTFRGNHRPKSCSSLPQLLDRIGVSRLVVGHTPGDDVRLLCQEQLLAIDSALGRWFRNSGNDYCSGHKTMESSNGKYQCNEINPYCEGQIVRIQNGLIHIIH